MKIWLLTCLSLLGGKSYGVEATKHAGSEQNREDKRLTITGDMTATMTPLTAPGSGAHLSVFITPKAVIEGGFVHSSTFEVFPDGNYNLSMLYNYAHLTYFLGNSFFVSAGGGQKTTNVNAALGSMLASDPKTPSNFSETIVTQGTEVGLGNRWMWRHFTLSCDWLTLYLPSGGKTSNQRVGEGVPDGLRKTYADRLVERTTTSGEGFMRIGFGESF